MKKVHFNKEKRYHRIWGISILIACIFLFTGTAYAADDAAITQVLLENNDIFVCNDIFMTAFRQVGWMLLSLLVKLGTSCAELFDNAFRFVDFTQIPEVEQFINSFKPVFIALICASLVFLGMILIFWHEKKPKLAMNICLAVLIVSSGMYLIKEMNQFLADDVRGAIVSSDANASRDMVYSTVGASITDLAYLDNEIGLMNLTKDNRVTYPNMTEQDVELININEIIKPDDVQDASKDLMGKRIAYYNGAVAVEEIYNGVAWTDLLNNYYYRYNVSWFTCIIALLSIAFIYICLAYKVVRILYEIVVHQLLAYLYSANLTSSQKTLKILEGIKDSYITLILILICVKIYTLAYYFINNLGVGAFTKAFLLLFVAFAVADGPNIIQKLTGIDAGLSSSIGKMLAVSQAARAAGHLIGAATSGASKIGQHLAEASGRSGDNIISGGSGDAANAFGTSEDYRNDMQSADSNRNQNQTNSDDSEQRRMGGQVNLGEQSNVMQEASTMQESRSTAMQENQSDISSENHSAFMQENQTDMSQQEQSEAMQENRSTSTQENQSDLNQAADSSQENRMETGFRDSAAYNPETGENQSFGNAVEDSVETDLNGITPRGNSGQAEKGLDSMEKEFSQMPQDLDSGLETDKGASPQFEGGLLHSNRNVETDSRGVSDPISGIFGEGISKQKNSRQENERPAQKEMNRHEVFNNTRDKIRNEGLETRIPH